MSAVATHRFNNALRYRDAHDPAQTALTPADVIEPLRELLRGIDLDPWWITRNGELWKMVGR